MYEESDARLAVSLSYRLITKTERYFLLLPLQKAVGLVVLEIEVFLAPGES